jgi:hypothetical protein
MNRGVFCLALGVLALAGGSLLAQRNPRGTEADAARNGWLFSLEAGKGEARKTGKPLMVVLRCVP